MLEVLTYLTLLELGYPIATGDVTACAKFAIDILHIFANNLATKRDSLLQ